MHYTVKIKRSAEKELQRFPKIIHDRIIKKILILKDNPRPPKAEKMSNRDAYKVRSGDYRILYTIDDRNKLVEIISVGHRREVYRIK